MALRAAIDHEMARPSGRVAPGIPDSTARILAASLLTALSESPEMLVERVERPCAERVGLVAQGALDLAIAVDAQPMRSIALTPLVDE